MRHRWREHDMPKTVKMLVGAAAALLLVLTPAAAYAGNKSKKQDRIEKLHLLDKHGDGIVVGRLLANLGLIDSGQGSLIDGGKGGVLNGLLDKGLTDLLSNLVGSLGLGGLGSSIS